MKKDKDKKLLIEQLKETPIVEFACKKTGISRASYYRWRKKSKEFAKIADEALMEGLLLINDMAESQLISAIKDKNISSIFFWLRHRHKAYTDKLEVINKEDSEKLSKKQKSLLREALRLVSNEVLTLKKNKQGGEYEKKEKENR